MKGKEKFKDILFLIKPWWKHGRWLLLGSFVSAVFFSPIAGYYSATLAQTVLETVQSEHSFKAALLIGVLYLSISMFFTLLKDLHEDMYCRWKRQEVEGRIEREVYKKALKVDYKYFDDPEYFDSYKLATEKFSTQSSETVQNIFSLLSVISCFFLYGYLIASHGITLFLIVLCCSVFVAYAQIYWSKVSVERESVMVNERRKADYLQRLFFDHTAVADMRSSGIKKPLFKMFDGSVENRVSIYKTYGMKELIIDVLVSIAQLGTTFAVPIYVAWGLISGNIEDIGVFATLIASSMALKDALNAMGWWCSQVSLGIAYSKKVQKFFDVDSTIETSTIGATPDSGAFSISLKDVSYSYPNSEPVIKGLNLSIAPGQKIAIVGENGAGKTTLIKLLLRLYDVDSGTICVNGRPLSNYNVAELRNQIGVAFQNSMLYALSVRENMTVYTDSNTDCLLKSLKDVDLHLDLDAQVTREFDESGVVLSGGDAQRLCLTRLLHSDFGLLVLDEPSSALDPIAEYNIANLIFNSSSTTTIMIAHRLSTIVDADMIYVLSDGSITEAGTHCQLMEKGGKYKEMFSKQAEGYLKGQYED